MLECGTIKATTNSIEAILENSDHKIFILNVFVNFILTKNENFKKLNIFPFLTFLPRYDIFKNYIFFLYFSVSFLLYYKIKPEIIYSSLVGYIPLILKFF